MQDEHTLQLEQPEQGLQLEQPVQELQPVQLVQDPHATGFVWLVSADLIASNCGATIPSASGAAPRSEGKTETISSFI